MPLDAMSGLLAGAGALVAILSVRWIIALVQSEDSESPLRMATEKTGRWSIAIVGAIAGLAGTGLVQFNELVVEGVAFIASHPYFVSNLGVGALGAGALSGVLDVSTGQYIGLVIAVIGLVFLVTEVESNA